MHKIRIRKPIAAATALSVFGAYTLTHDGNAQARDPLGPAPQHDTFQLVLGTSTSTIVTVQNTITGDLLVVPPLEPVKNIKRAKST